MKSTKAESITHHGFTITATITLGPITMIIYRKFQIFDDTAKQEREMGYMGGRGYLVGGTWRGEVLGKMKVVRVSNAGRARTSPVSDGNICC